MTIIFQKGSEFWIESHFIARATVVSGGVKTELITLDKPGSLLAYVITVDQTPNGDNACFLQDTLGATLTLGESIVSVNAFVENRSAGSMEMGYNVILYMRGRGLHS